MNKVVSVNSIDSSKIDYPWWIEAGSTGEVAVEQLLPDPTQPRKHMSETELEELAGSIAKVGVREPVTVTPISKCPWLPPDIHNSDSFFLIVSGHRRYMGSLKAVLKVVPVRVQIYESEEDHYLDRSILNKNRSDLTPLEEGYEVVMHRSKMTMDEISQDYGCSVVQLYNLINLTKLYPHIQDLISPTKTRHERLPLTIAYALGGIAVPTAQEIDTFLVEHEEIMCDLTLDQFSTMSDDDRRHRLQKYLLQVIELKKYRSVKAVKFIKGEVQEFENTSNISKSLKNSKKPSKLKRSLKNLLNSVEGSVVLDWTAKEWASVSDVLTSKEVDTFLLQVSSLTGTFGVIKSHLGKAKVVQTHLEKINKAQ